MRIRLETEEGEKQIENFTYTITGMEFIFVKSGTFDIGDTFGGGYDCEKLVHKVTLNDFYMAKYPVTQAE